MALFLQSWIPFALFAGIGLFGYNLCAKLGGGNLPPLVFAFVMYISGFITVLPMFLWYLKDKPSGFLSSLPTMPLIYAMGAGIVVIAVDTSVSYMFNKGAPVGVGMTSINIVSIMLTSLAGFYFFKENYSLVNLVGIAFALVSIPLMFYSQK